MRLGRVLLYGSGLATGGLGAYTVHNAGYEANNIGEFIGGLRIRIRSDPECFPRIRIRNPVY